MKFSVAFLLLLAGMLVPAVLNAQVSLEKERAVAVAGKDSVFVLEPWILPESFEVYADSFLITEPYSTLFPIEGIWVWNQPKEERETFDSLYFYYRVWPHDLPVTWREREVVKHKGEQDIVLVAEPVSRRIQGRDLFEGTTLQRSGSIRRGIVIGSGRDMSMDSGLRFDISGHITEDLEVVASLTDQSTPIQPEGTTQTLREFDQVNIRLMHQLGTLQMGDVDLQLNQSRFAVIDRRVQGVDVQFYPEQHGHHQASASVVRGNYHEMSFLGIDGVQGPYRLTGAENETFIIVLAGSERVYVDGRRVHRGEENDYVIDYGIGEITFTSRQIITGHTRVTVDFQYVTDAYTRTLIAADSEVNSLMNGRLSFGASVVREADNANMSTRFFLSEQDRDILEMAGNDRDKAVVSGADSVGFRHDADYLLYSAIDTLYQGELYRIYKHIPGDSSGVYRVQFSRIGEGKGAYRRVGRAANGILYEWVGPGNGNYLPQRRLPMPYDQRMIALRSTFMATSNLYVFSEWAGSYYDQNRLSDSDNEDTNDMALLAGFRLNPVQTSIGTIAWEFTGRFEGRNFFYFDRAREVEFDRRWNIRSRPPGDEIRYESSMNWMPAKGLELNIGAGYMTHLDYEGNRVDLEITYNETSVPSLYYHVEIVNSEDTFYDESSVWWRHRGRTEYTVDMLIGQMIPSLSFEAEDRRQQNVLSDSLLFPSTRFYDVAPELAYQVTDGLLLGASVSYREDESVLHGELEKESVGITQRYRLQYVYSDKLRSEHSVGFRKRTYKEAFKLEHQSTDSRAVLVRSITDLNLWNRFFESRILYDVNTERRPLLQEAYIDVGPEMGNYVWVDVNKDGIQQIDEFFPEQAPNEGTFIKQLVPSDELFPVIALKARLSAVLDFSNLIDPFEARYSNWLDFLSGVRLQTVVDIQEDNRTQDLEDIYLLRVQRFQDDSLTIRGRVYIEQEVELFRHDSRKEVRITGEYARSQNQQASGLEKQNIVGLNIRSGARLSRRYRLAFQALLGKRTNDSEMFLSRNYTITTYSVRPRLDIRWNNTIQSGVGLRYHLGKDSYPEDAAIVNGVAVLADSRWHLATRWQAVIRAEWRSHQLDGGPVSSLGEFELTDGAGLGSTWSWSVQSDYRISDFLRANVQYDGRTLTGRPLIQTMRFTVSAVF